MFQYYIDLNDPYLKMNTKRLEDGQSDYLAMLSPPTFEVLSSPQYINDDVIVSFVNEPEGYLSMKPNSIFSPRTTEGNNNNINNNFYGVKNHFKVEKYNIFYDFLEKQLIDWKLNN